MLSRERRKLPQHPIFKESIEQFGRELENFFPDRDTVPAFLVKHDEDLKDIKRDLNGEQGIPLFAYSLDTLSPNKETRNRGFLARHGLSLNKPKNLARTIRLEDPWLEYDTLYLTPADLTFNVSYYCNFDEQYEFGPLWQQAAQHRYLDFDLEIENIEIHFRVELSEDITFSPVALDDNSYLRVSTSAVLKTYHGNLGKVKAFTSMKINTGIVDHGDEPNKEVKPSMSITREKSRTFTIKNKIDGEDYKLEDN